MGEGINLDNIFASGYVMKIDDLEVSFFDIVVLTGIIAITAYFLWKHWYGDPNDKLTHRVPLKVAPPDTEDINSPRSLVTAAKRNGNRVIFLYGSQTGTAEIFASRLAKEGSTRFGLQTMTADLEDYDFDDLEKFPSNAVLVFLLATYGEGDPTDSAIDFYEFFTSPDSEFASGTSLCGFLSGSPEDDSAYGSTTSSSDGDNSDGKTLLHGVDDTELPLNKLNFAVFGLGNKTYEHYNVIARHTDIILRKLGASRIGPLGLGDDASGTTEDELIAWKEKFWVDLYSVVKYVERTADYEPQFNLRLMDWDKSNVSVYLGEPNRKHLYNMLTPPFNLHHPFMAEVTETRELFRNAAQRHCIHMELSIVGSQINYESGDHAAIWPMNPDDQVDKLLHILGLSEKRDKVFRLKSKELSTKVPIPEPTTYDSALRYYIDICGPVSRDFLKNVAQFGPTIDAKVRCKELSDNPQEFRSQVINRCCTLADVLFEIHPQWPAIPFTLLIESLPHLQARYYSISSSPARVTDRLSLTVVVDEKRDEHGKRYFAGVSTNYLRAVHNTLHKEKQDICYSVNGPRGRFNQGHKLLMHVRKSTFRLPRNQKAPIIMIGPGTGIAPFRAFIQDKICAVERGEEIGDVFLFYGCRRAKHDFVYSEDWQEAMAKLGDKFRMTTAYSRDQKQKVYVQHLMAKPDQAERLRHAIVNENAYVYICGDAKRMARDVTQVISDIIGPEGQPMVKEMKASGRFQEDVWS